MTSVPVNSPESISKDKEQLFQIKGFLFVQEFVGFRGGFQGFHKGKRVL